MTARDGFFSFHFSLLRWNGARGSTRVLRVLCFDFMSLSIKLESGTTGRRGGLTSSRGHDMAYIGLCWRDRRLEAGHFRVSRDP
ncbi:hypothetical protein BDZ85DRAFT_132309 [Elsinoe ampelina]|uniref:Uncharacterized protein n=1 Tax=Elsinoe ampelina TaxID=302913 RepID=A0A6A6G803_9PEZI|nr:hypothetical protein BDZ85DRAFT_132309 [Elsinoe ampelina]